MPFQKLTFGHPPPLGLPNDSQCPTCGYFDITRLDVLDLIWAAINSGGYPQLTVALAKCKCGRDTVVQGNFTTDPIRSGQHGQQV
jgi:hypothetical protein